MNKTLSTVALSLVAIVIAGSLGTDRAGDPTLSEDRVSAAVDLTSTHAATASAMLVASDKPTTHVDAERLTAEVASVVGADSAVLSQMQSRSSNAKKTDVQDDQPVRAIDKMSGELAAIVAQAGDTPVELIVRYDDMPEMFEGNAIERLGGEVVRSFDALGMRAIRIPADAVELFAGDSDVEWLSLDSAVATTSIASRQAAHPPSQHSPLSFYGGSNIGVAVIDTGVSHHMDMPNGVKQYSFVGGAFPRPHISKGRMVNPNNGQLGDNYGHGTHVAGILAGSGMGSFNKYQGLAKSASLLSLQVLDTGGKGSMSDVISALDWLLQYGHHFNIRVVNLSLGKTVSESNTTDPMVAAVDRLWDAGFVVVVAAGNSGLWGNMTINSPGNSRKAITVGSISDRGTGHNFSDDRRSSFSSRGPSAGDHVLKPDLMAPGNRVVAAVDGNSQLARWLWWRKRACDRYCAGTYLEMSGTSMAAPMVAAAAALMLEKEPHLSPDTIKARLMRSARRVNDDLTSVGAGTLDIMAAMTQTGVMHRPALSPLVQQSTSGALLIENTAALWGHPHWSNASLYHGSSSWNAAGGNTGTISGVSANGYLWTDETVSARGYLWTDEVFARGYLWTDEETVRARSLLSVDENGNVIMNDDP